MDIKQIRRDFPILGTKVLSGKPLVYLDSAASSQMPQAVIDRIVRYQTTEHSNIHRNAHYLGELATNAFEDVRSKVQKFINARESREIIFTSGTTDSVNLVMQSYGRTFIQQGDEIILSAMEHHSNIVPWQMLATEKGAILKIIPMNENGELLQDAYKALFNSKTKLVALTHASNALGTINPIKSMIAVAHGHGVPVLIDGAQAAPHMPIDMQDLDCDFYAFSGHKMYGPTGVGVLYGKADYLEKMPPYRGGGEMILSVSFEKTVYNVIPYKFEAGTPPIMPVIALGAAIDYINEIGMSNIVRHGCELLEYATHMVSQIDGVTIIGRAKEKVPVLSFSINGVHPHDIGTILDDMGIAVRTGHHCAEPVMRYFKIPGTTRASFALYNTMEEVDQLALGIKEVLKIFH